MGVGFGKWDEATNEELADVLNTRTTSRCCPSVLHLWENWETGETVFSYF